MTVFSIQNQKGGVGKTTLALHIAHGLQRLGGRILLIDADPQGSALDWAAARVDAPPFAIVGLDRPTIHRDLPTISSGYDHVVIDGPPRVTDQARSVVAASNVVIIPVQPSPYDVWACEEIVKLLREAIVFQPLLKSAFAINRKIVNTAIGRDVGEALAGYGLPILRAQICQRVAFAECATVGQTVLESDPNSAAAAEIKSLVTEMLEFSNAT